MDPTIYTMGDPMIVREALFALAAIFNSADWFNPANAFGLGGNLLAAALIGLIGILIAGINSQTMRVDYLLTAFVLFAIAFGVKVDVNIEDIQTGNAATVDDVPAGVAYVAALASSTSYELAQDISTALQRPGSETSVMTADGFLNPLKVLLALREMRLEALDPTLYATLMSYYRFCVGKTLEQPGSPFSMREFTNTVDPILYLTDHGNVQNWMTVEYTELAPEGFAQPCHDVADSINVRIDALTAGLDDRLVTWASRKLGSRTYEGGYTLADLQDSLDILNRSGLSAQNVMANMFIANLHNAGEAWRVAEYGTDKSQYVATLTEAMESQRVEVATQGSMFLQMMFPLMGFFQFLFFALPPIIVLVMLAAPAAAVRILGFYLLFGVWAYGWIPIAAVINHYVEIAVQNDIEFARGALDASGYTSILGFDSLYNVVATKLTIGANALASVPVILGAILTATPFAISNIAGRMAGGGKVNTSIAAPSLLNNGPVMQRAGLASAPVGSVVSSGGSFVPGSAQQRSAWGTVDYGSALSSQVRAQTERATQYRKEASTAITSAANTIKGVVTSSEISDGQRQRYEASIKEAVGSAYRNSVDHTTQSAVGADREQAVMAQFAAEKFGIRLGSGANSRSVLSKDERSAVDQMLARSEDTVAAAASSIADTAERETEVGRSLKHDVAKAKTANESAAKAESEAETAAKVLERKESLGLSGRIEVGDLATQAYLRDADALGKLNSIVAGAGGASLLNRVDGRGKELFAETGPVGLDGKRDDRMDRHDRLSATFRALDELARSGDAEAGRAYIQGLREVGGVSVPMSGETVGTTAGGAEKAADEMANAGAFGEGVDKQMEGVKQGIKKKAVAVDEMSEGLSADARMREDVTQMQGAWTERVNAIFANQDHPVRQAVKELDAAMGAAQREQDKSLATKAVDWARPGSGSDAEARAQLEAVPAGHSEEAVWAGARAVAALGGLMRAQGDVSANPEKVYEDLVNAKWTPKAAAQAAYASAGARTSGGGELLAAGLGVSAVTGGVMNVGQARAAGAAGAAAPGSQAAVRAASAARWFGLAGRIAGPVAGAVTVVGGAAVASWADKKNAAAIDAELHGSLMEAARTTMGDERFKQFEGWMQQRGGAANAEQLANFLSVFETGSSPTTGEVGAFPAVGGDVKQTVGVWSDRIDKLD